MCRGKFVVMGFARNSLQRNGRFRTWFLVTVTRDLITVDGTPTVASVTGTSQYYIQRSF